MERQDSNGFCFFVQNETIGKKVFKMDFKNFLLVFITYAREK